MTGELVHLAVADDVATITLDSQHNRNALSRQLVAELTAHLRTAGADDGAKLVLLRSKHPVFCSGADLSDATADPESGLRTIVELQRVIATLPKPVVVELRGPVRAGGLGIVGAADIVLAVESVTFALTEVRLALAPAVISLSLLERFTSRAAAELFLTGRRFTAAEAADAGLVTRVVEDLDAEVAAVIAELRQAHPQGLRETKALVNRDLIERIDTRADDAVAQSARLFASADAAAAVVAFFAGKS